MGTVTPIFLLNGATTTRADTSNTKHDDDHKARDRYRDHPQNFYPSAHYAPMPAYYQEPYYSPYDPYHQPQYYQQGPQYYQAAPQYYQGAPQYYQGTPAQGYGQNSGDHMDYSYNPNTPITILQSQYSANSLKQNKTKDAVRKMSFEIELENENDNTNTNLNS
jgi:hypothetical protein